MKLIRSSEDTLTIFFDQKISHNNLVNVTTTSDYIRHTCNQYIIELVPAYCSIHITFNLSKISGESFFTHIDNLLKDLQTNPHKNIAKKTLPNENKTLHIPVYYGTEVGADLQALANFAKTTIDRVIQIHHQKTYNVYAIGFAPGFAYMGSVDTKIAMPRRATPRTNVPAGSLAIANQQTAIYPSNSPGGWQIIGRTYVSTLNYADSKLTPFSVGQHVRFIPISKEAYLDNGGTLSWQ